MERNFREIARNAGDVEIHCGACGHTMEYAHLLWDIGMEPPCPKCRAMELRNDGWKQFWAKNEHETRDAAIALGWLPRSGMSEELDIFLLPDGPEVPPEEYYDELCNALDWRQEQVRETKEEEEEEGEAACDRCGEPLEGDGATVEQDRHVCLSCYELYSPCRECLETFLTEAMSSGLCVVCAEEEEEEEEEEE